MTSTNTDGTANTNNTGITWYNWWCNQCGTWVQANSGHYHNFPYYNPYTIVYPNLPIKPERKKKMTGAKQSYKTDQWGIEIHWGKDVSGDPDDLKDTTTVFLDPGGFSYSIEDAIEMARYILQELEDI